MKTALFGFLLLAASRLSAQNAPMYESPATKQFCDSQQMLVTTFQPLLNQVASSLTVPAGIQIAGNTALSSEITTAFAQALGIQCQNMRVWDNLQQLTNQVAALQQQIATLQAQIVADQTAATNASASATAAQSAASSAQVSATNAANSATTATTAVTTVKQHLTTAATALSNF